MDAPVFLLSVHIEQCLRRSKGALLKVAAGATHHHPYNWFCPQVFLKKFKRRLAAWVFTLPDRIIELPRISSQVGRRLIGNVEFTVLIRLPSTIGTYVLMCLCAASAF